MLRAEAPFPSFIHPRFIAIDWYLNVRLARQHQVYYVAKTLTDYRIHPANHFNSPLREFDEEQSVIGTLDQLCDEKTPLMRSRKFRNRAYCEAYLRLGNRYFGGGRYADARRCYIHTLWFQPKTFLQAGGLHRLIGTTLGTERYAYLKQQIRRVKPHD